MSRTFFGFTCSICGARDYYENKSLAEADKWFEIWSSVDGPTKDELVEKIENDAPDWDDFDYDTLLSIYNKIKGR